MHLFYLLAAAVLVLVAIADDEEKPAKKENENELETIFGDRGSVNDNLRDSQQIGSNAKVGVKEPTVEESPVTVQVKEADKTAG